MIETRLPRWMIVPAVPAALVAALLGCQSRVEANRPIVTVDRTVTYQTMTGWEATARAGEVDFERGGLSSAFLAYKDRLFDLAVNDLGLNRLRLEIRSGAENPRDYFGEFLAKQLSLAEWKRHRYEKVNDNDDPHVIDPRGFHYSELDTVIEHIVIPIRERLQARGERLFLNLTYVDFARGSWGRQRPGTAVSTLEHYDHPDEYAEFMLAAFQHMRGRYGLVPDAIEVALEPDNTPWTGLRLGQAVAAAAHRLRQHGFAPCFIGPATTSMSNAALYFDDMVSIPGVQRVLREIAYHRYRGVSDHALRDIASRAVRYGIRTGMLEHIGSGHESLHADLTLGHASSWQQYTLAYPGERDWGQYYSIDLRAPANPAIVMGTRTRLLRQYFKHVRAGATRIDATAGDHRLSPAAFVNRDGGHVVVVNAAASGPVIIAGLPPGSYGITYATEAEAAEQADITLQRGESLATAIPDGGVMTIFAKSGRSPVPPAEPATCP